MAALEDRNGLDAVEQVLEANRAVLHHTVFYASVALLRITKKKTIQFAQRGEVYTNI
jgi:hypothetical protein